MNRKLNPYTTLFVPTVVIDDSRHIIAHRDGPTLCGAERHGETVQVAPAPHKNGALCPRCTQKYIRSATGTKQGSWS